mmetsp:Transcript_28498/g.91976  ORF Transcript_28498/g.91976 Transcript_28498/m.91976 type:complete len:104 (+) Transcript_28498:201-512(+)
MRWALQYISRRSIAEVPLTAASSTDSELEDKLNHKLNIWSLSFTRYLNVYAGSGGGRRRRGLLGRPRSALETWVAIHHSSFRFLLAQNAGRACGRYLLRQVSS